MWKTDTKIIIQIFKFGQFVNGNFFLRFFLLNVIAIYHGVVTATINTCLLYTSVTNGGVKRVFVEEVNGNLQGCVFRFIQGLEAGINRLCWGPDGSLYVGGIGNPGNWGQSGKLYYGLQRLTYNGKMCIRDRCWASGFMPSGSCS